MHETDEKALEQLKGIPGFEAAVKAFMKVWNDDVMQVVNMSSKVRLGENQLPQVYRLLPPIAQRFGIAEPEMYLELSPVPQAYTSGTTRAYITVTSGLLDIMPEEELTAILAHECAHIACKHLMYHTMVSLFIGSGAKKGEEGGLSSLISLPLQLAFLAWERCSEFSCDRAAALYMGEHKPMVNALMYLAGGKPDKYGTLNTDVYVEQAQAYCNDQNDGFWEKTLKFMLTSQQDHPLLAVRALEIKKWCESPQYCSIMARADMPLLTAGEGLCPRCGAQTHEGWRFCKACGFALDQEKKPALKAADEDTKEEEHAPIG